MDKFIDFPMIERIVLFMAKHKHSADWRRGYTTAFYVTGLITTNERDIVLDWVNGKTIK